MRMEKYEPGSFCWVDLATSDVPAAKSFYGELFGWSLVDTAAGPETTYTMCDRGGLLVAALYAMSKDEATRTAPHWNNYVSVESAAETAARVSRLGGRVLAAPFEVTEVGRMAVFQDPTGARLALWEPNKHIGATLLHEPGAMCWNELLTSEPERAQPFYTALFGWSAVSEDLGSGVPYTVFSCGETPAAGMMRSDPAWGPAPARWAVYFEVESADGTVRRAQRLGGRTVVEPMDVPEVGRMAMMLDPQGASFAMMQPLA